MLLTQGYFGIGIVEDSIDPKGLGRVRVRILDIHGSDKLKIPTDSLPWANVLHAANYSSHFERIKENTYIMAEVEKANLIIQNQKDLAKAMEVTPQQITKIVSGEEGRNGSTDSNF